MLYIDSCLHIVADHPGSLAVGRHCMSIWTGQRDLPTRRGLNGEDIGTDVPPGACRDTILPDAACPEISSRNCDREAQFVRHPLEIFRCSGCRVERVGRYGDRGFHALLRDAISEE